MIVVAHTHMQACVNAVFFCLKLVCRHGYVSHLSTGKSKSDPRSIGERVVSAAVGATFGVVGSMINQVCLVCFFLPWPCHSYKSWQTHLGVILAIWVQGSTAYRLQAPMLASVHLTGHIDHLGHVVLIERVTALLAVVDVHDMRNNCYVAAFRNRGIGHLGVRGEMRNANDSTYDTYRSWI